MTLTDDYGEAMEVARSESREVAAFVSRGRGGGWLVAMSGPAFDDATPDDCYFAAGSERAAKRIARDDAEAAGYTGPWRWLPMPFGFELEAAWVDERLRYVDP